MAKRNAFAILLALYCSGCVLPVPHKRAHVYGVRGTVVVANSSPIAHALVTGNEKAGVACRSGEDGRFELPPVYGWHGAYLVGPICQSILPGWDATIPARTIRVQATGYRAETFGISSVPEGDYMDAGTLRMKTEERRREP
jgi:hypothetical protein